ncbi:hypothetical protein OK074_2556 [Actinobacteria bacterium OK074]|nr:hypothetical protein OK074_2556 [Actinobacteria bacterium OK074]
MGWTVLYIAFGIVALWLLGEVLLQYKARLRWRLLAFAGFVGVVFGVLIPSVVVIALGAAAFAVGQTYVTLSFRRGFAEGWAVGNPNRDEGEDGPGPIRGFLGSRRRRGESHEEPAPESADRAEYPESTPPGTYGRTEAFDDEHDDVFTRPQQPAAHTPAGGTAVFEQVADATAVYEPQPLPEETGNYGVYGGDQPYPAADPAYAAAATTDPAYATAADGSYAGQDAGQNFGYDGYSGYDQQQYGYDNSQQPYAAYSDPYIGAQTYNTGEYDANGYAVQDQYGQQAQGYGQDQYAAGNGTGGYGETPPGGVWVPQQRAVDDPFGTELPPEQQYPYQQQNGDGTGHGQGHGQGQGEHGLDDQYRF